MGKDFNRYFVQNQNFFALLNNINKNCMSQKKQQIKALADQAINSRIKEGFISQNHQRRFQLENASILKVQESEKHYQKSFLNYFQEIEQFEASNSIFFEIVETESFRHQSIAFEENSYLRLRDKFAQQHNLGIKQLNECQKLVFDHKRQHKKTGSSGNQSYEHFRMQEDSLHLQPEKTSNQKNIDEHNSVLGAASLRQLKKNIAFNAKNVMKKQVGFKLSKQGKKMARFLFDGDQIKTKKVLPKKSKIQKLNQKAYCISSKRKIIGEGNRIEKRVVRSKQIRRKLDYCQNEYSTQPGQNQKISMQIESFKQGNFTKQLFVDDDLRQNKELKLFIRLENGTKVRKRNPFVIIDRRSQNRHSQLFLKKDNEWQAEGQKAVKYSQSQSMKQISMNSTIKYDSNGMYEIEDNVQSGLKILQSLESQEFKETQGSFQLFKCNWKINCTNLFEQKILEPIDLQLPDSFSDWHQQ